MKLYLLLFLAIFLSGCQYLQTKESVEHKHPSTFVTTIDSVSGVIKTSETVGLTEKTEREIIAYDSDAHFEHPNPNPFDVATHQKPLTDESSGGSQWTLGDNLSKITSTIFGSISRIIVFIIIIVVILFILRFAVPVLQPVIDGLGRFIASAIPFIGSLIENLIAKIKYKKPLEQTVAAVDEYKKTLTQQERDEMNNILKTKQDVSTQDLIDSIRK